MSSRFLPASLALVLALGPVRAPLAAQETAPRRPRLDAPADSNDPRAYYQFGLTKLTTDPALAGSAFWWAMRLDPAWADPIYAYRVARLMSSDGLMEGLLTDNERVLRSDEMRRLDSLQLRAVSINPFLHRKLDATMLRYYFIKTNKAEFDRYRMRRDAEAQADFMVEDADLERWIDNLFKNTGGRFRAWYAYSQGRFPEAIRAYESEAKRARPEFRAEIQADLARAYFLRGERPQALVHLRAALEELRARDARALVRAYESRAVYEHGIGLTHELNNQPDSARAAYQRALQEDLAYWPAHRQLGLLHLASGDTAAAIAELDQAVQLKGDDASLRYNFGFVLATAGQVTEAVQQFREAITLDPDYPAPYAILGRIYDAGGFPAEAARYYKAYMAHAPARDPQVARAAQRVTALAAEAPANAESPKTP